ncbi:hypothetical protein DXG03_002380 [Asterophora parasitica]|uniref:Pyruvate carboxylase n=1 Tax=Asterophora parasitica TaxID=117018 RepID=A0A9P7K8P5_9AGAR|nr:hypothetical protein DXG03_002380 [Asterophora parasitica]
MSGELLTSRKGYGFLSESPALAQALPDSITFIGPSTETLRLSSDKMLSRDLATSLGVAIAAGVGVRTTDDVRAFARAQGFPVMIKALDGGGGRGIRIVEIDNDVEEAFNRYAVWESLCRVKFSLRKPSQARIGNTLRFRLSGTVQEPLPIFGKESAVYSGGELRTCSFSGMKLIASSRFQKIVETAPSRLPRSIISSLVDSSMKLARHLNYRGLGTFEYLVNSQTLDWVFLEINPRVQVEHTVTEEVTGIDLVRTQLLLFDASSTSPGSLSLTRPPPPPQGYAIQLRLTAEDSSCSFRLSPGTLKPADIVWPSGPGIRIDTWLSTRPISEDSSPQWNVGTEFDSLLAKVIARGHTFEEASQKARRALKELRILSLTTNRDILAGVLDHQDWLTGNIDTLWLERNIDDVRLLGKSLAARTVRGSGKIASRDDAPAGNFPASSTTLLQPGALFHLTVSSSEDTSASPTKHSLSLISISHNGFPDKLSGVLQSSLSPIPLAFSLSQSTSAAISSSIFELANPNDALHIASPLTGKVVELHAALLAAKGNGGGAGRFVRRGETIVILSIMKMESTIKAPRDAFVKRLGNGIQVGAVLGEGTLICVMGDRPQPQSSRL